MKISFLHTGDVGWASYRYRAMWPSQVIGAVINDPRSDVLIFSKPMPSDLAHAYAAKHDGRTVIVDYCDDHFNRNEYRQLLHIADGITCPTPTMADRIRGHLSASDLHVPIHVIPEPYELEETPAHAERRTLLWFGHPSNMAGYFRVKKVLDAAGHRVIAVSNFAGAIPWSLKTLSHALQEAGIVFIPATADYKSANRAIEATRQGCAVVAEPHPSFVGKDWIFQGDILTGVRLVRDDPSVWNDMVQHGQKIVGQDYSPTVIGELWLNAIRLITREKAA